MDSARLRAESYVTGETEFHLGALPTEQSHPKTRHLAQTCSENLPAGISMLQEVDRDLLPVLRRVLAGRVLSTLVETLVETIVGGHRVFLTGCGATGRLAILLETAWRHYFRSLRQRSPGCRTAVADLENRVVAIMAGGDQSLVRSLEGFEDFADFGKHHLREAGVGTSDLVLAITEGGETSYVIGTVWEGLAAGARVFFVYNNPTDILAVTVRRSREIIEDRRIHKLDLSSGPMAVAGSTRMQATTAELMAVGAALETALGRIVRETLPPEATEQAGMPNPGDEDPLGVFAAVLASLSTPASVDAFSRAASFEEELYAGEGLLTYMADDYLLDIFTDTTERAPTFRLPSFRKIDDPISPPSWAFVKNPLYPTALAWNRLLEREPRCLEWDATTYRRLGAPERFVLYPPRIDRHEILKFLIGNEEDLSRVSAATSAAVWVAVEGGDRTAGGAIFREACEAASRPYSRKLGISIGVRQPDSPAAEEVFEFPGPVPPSPLRLGGHLAVKLVLNTISTATMARMGRIRGNWMVCVETTNKKLIDRGTRLIAELTGMGYREACVVLHETMDEIQCMSTAQQAVTSPVWLAISRHDAGTGRTPSEIRR